MAADTSTLTVLAVGFSVFALVVVVALAVRVGKLIRTYDALVGGDEQSSFVAAVGRQTATAARAADEVSRLREELAAMRSGLSDVVRHVAVARYDAFSDQGGALSFSVALLDDRGDGVVLTSINARSETRTYVREIRGGASEQALSPEERDVLAEARRAAPSPAGSGRGA